MTLYSTQSSLALNSMSIFILCKKYNASEWRCTNITASHHTLTGNTTQFICFMWILQDWSCSLVQYFYEFIYKHLEIIYDKVIKTQFLHPRIQFDDFLNEVQDLLAQGKYDESIALADKILTQHAEILNTLAFAFDKKGYSLTKSGRPQQALKFNDKAVALNDDDAICHVNRSFTLGGLGRYEESLEEWKNCLMHL